MPPHSSLALQAKTPSQVLSLLPILLSSSIPVAGASSRRFALAVRSILRPAEIRRRRPLPPLPSFSFPQPLFSPVHPTLGSSAGLLTTPSASNPVASRPLVFEFFSRPRRETFHALQSPAITLDAYEKRPQPFSTLSPRANLQATSLRLHRRRLPPVQLSTAISLPHRRMTRPVAISSRSTPQPSHLARVLTGAVMLPRPRQ